MGSEGSSVFRPKNQDVSASAAIILDPRHRIQLAVSFHEKMYLMTIWEQELSATSSNLHIPTCDSGNDAQINSIVQ